MHLALTWHASCVAAFAFRANEDKHHETEIDNQCRDACSCGDPTLAQSKSVKIGFVSTFSGPAAAIGKDMRNSFELGLEHIGRTMGGLPVEMIYEDDQLKPELGKQKTDKLIDADKVDFLVGYIWSNVLLASLKSAVDSNTFLIATNAGPSQLAGELCSPYVFSTGRQNDQTPQVMGMHMNQKGVKSLFMIGPNYAAGKDMLGGAASTFKGKNPWPGIRRSGRSTGFFCRVVKGARRKFQRDLCITIPVAPACSS